MKFVYKLILLFATLSLVACSFYWQLDYRLPTDFEMSVNKSLPEKVVVWQTDVLQSDIPRVYNHQSVSHGGNTYGREPYHEMTDELMIALQDAFKRVPIFEQSPHNPPITVRATVRELSFKSLFGFCFATAKLRYQFIYENKVFHEIELETSDTVFDTAIIFMSKREFDAMTHAVQKNLMALLEYLNQPENQTVFLSGSLKTHSQSKD